MIEDCIARAAWPDALRAALAAWQECPTAHRADLIDAISARCVGARPSPRAWCERACVYDPVDASTLLAHVEPRDDECADEPVRERETTHADIRMPFAAIATLDYRITYLIHWPADPRVLAAVIGWCERCAFRWPRWWYSNPGTSETAQQLFAAIAAWVEQIPDARARGRLEQLAARPPGRSQGVRAGQLAVARAALAAIDRGARDEPEPARILALIDQVGRPTRVAPMPRPTFEIDALWAAVAAAPDDDEPRLVLADALLDRGDPRGEVIVQQIRRRSASAALPLIHRHWPRWIGADLARLLLRNSCRFTRGMLEVVRVGQRSTPAWLYADVVGHRELVAVRQVRAYKIDPQGYARFVAALPNVTAVDVDRVATSTALAAQRTLARITRVVLRSRAGEPYDQIMAPLADTSPLETLVIEPGPRAPFDRVVQNVSAVASMFPRASLELARVPGSIDRRALLAAIPRLQICDR